MNIKDIRSSKNGTYVKYEDNTWKKVPNEWYFYVEKEQFDLVPERMYSHFLIGKEYVRIYCNVWDARREFLYELEERGIRTYEGDLKAEERYKYDNDFKISTKQDILYFDIETDDRLKKIEIGRDYILSWVAYDNSGNVFREEISELTPQEEERIINRFYNLCRDYDIIAGWNIDRFDIPYFRARGERYGLRFPNVGRYDLYARMKHIYRFDSTIKSFSLENIAQTFLNEGKIKHDGTYALWSRHDGSLLKYNERDTDLTKRIDEKLKISEMMILQSSWCKSLPRKFSLYSLIDSVIIQKAHELRKPVPTNLKALRDYDDSGSNDSDIEKYMGAVVLEPEIGYHDDVYVFDFTSLYPSIIMTINAGYDTLNYTEGIMCPGTHTVPREKRGLVPTYFKKVPSCVAETEKYLIGLRKEYKELKLKYIENGWTDKIEYQKIVSDEIIVKELSNSLYGIMGMQFGRYYNVDVAESITLTGRWILSFARQVFNDMGYKVIYGDTDSIFVACDGKELDIEHCRSVFHDRIRKELKEQFNADECYIKLGFDKHYVSFMLFAKKNYCGLMDNHEGKKVDRIYVRGLEYIKRDAFRFAAEKQKELCELILRHQLPISQVLYKIRDYKTEFYKRKWSKEELELSIRINKDKYDGNSVSAFLSKTLIEKTGVNPEGTEVRYIVKRAKPRIVVELSDEWDGYFSEDYYWYNATSPLLDKVLQLVDPGKNIDQDLLFY